MRKYLSIVARPFGHDRLRELVSALWLSLCIVPAVVTAADEPNANLWPQFRGPDGQGHASETGLPTTWSEKKNIVWKTPIPGQGWSSPSIQGDQIWLTSALDAGASLHALCVDRTTGAIRHDIEIFQKQSPGRVHQKNGYASPTPVIVGERVFVHFGANGTACLSSAGAILWKTEISYYHHHGPGPSPILVGNKLILVCDGFTAPFYDTVKRTPPSPQFVVALDVENGKEVWNKPRDGHHSYGTPLAIDVAGRTQIVSPGGDRVIAYDAESGAEIWWCKYTGYSVIPRPVFGHGLVYVCTGYDAPATILAIKPDGQGDVTSTHVAWKLRNAAVSLTPSPILVGEELYLVNDDGIATCFDAKSGKVHWRQRLGGNFSASPIESEGRLYFLGETGLMHIVEAGKKFKKIVTSGIDGPTYASPAVAGKSIFLRNGKFLYRIEEAEK